jgi:chromosome segregation ATPase
VRLKTILKLTALAPALCLASLPVHARQEQQSSSQQQTGDAVADAARKAREQKKDAPKPKKVYTDDDMRSKDATGAASEGAAGSTQATPSAAAGSGETAQATPENAAATPAGGAKNDEATWRKRFQAQRDKIATAEKELDILQREADKGQVQYYSDPQKALNEQYSRKAINETKAKIDAKKQEIANLKQQLSDMEDDLRKAGGDPGWARE